MENFILSCCSTADLQEEHFLSRGINYLCFSFMLDNVSYKDDLGKTMPYDKFYKALSDGADAKTTQLNAEEYTEYFTPFLKSGKDVLHVCFSSGLSGSYNSAVIASKELLKEYPERKLYIVDSLCASSGYGLLMDKLADLRDEGMNIDELYNWANSNKLRVHHLFFSTDLTSYIKGGRVSKTAGLVGTILNICPLLCMDENGRIVLKRKAMGKKGAMKKIISKMEELCDGGLLYNEKCYICNSNCLLDARLMADIIKDRFPRLNGEVCINNIGATVGSHTGSGTIAVFFWGKPRND